MSRGREGGREGDGMQRVGDEDVEESRGEPRRRPAMHVNVTPLHVTVESRAQRVHMSEPTSQLAAPD